MSVLISRNQREFTKDKSSEDCLLKKYSKGRLNQGTSDFPAMWAGAPGNYQFPEGVSTSSPWLIEIC